MLAKKYRLTKRNDFQSVFKEGKKGFSKFFGIRFKVSGLENPRIAIVASTKVSKKAVERNKLRRQTRKAVDVFLPNFKQNVDVIINIMSPSLGQDYSFLEKELSLLLKKNKII
jgi:ribonuclease P protein component